MKNASATLNFIQPEGRDDRLRIALLVEYCGKLFHGSQFQPEQLTVQGALQQALAQLGLQSSAVSFASRTDSGVHARGQVAHFDIVSKPFNIASLEAALNAVLPSDITIRACYVGVAANFHSRREAQAKWYRYRLYNGRQRSSLAGPDAAYHHCKLNIGPMAEAAQLLLGTQDFTSFQSANASLTNPICTMHHFIVTQEGDFINFDIAANRFLYKMVRNLVGQLLRIGNSETPLPPESILEVLARRHRAQAASPARPEGLCLMAVHYPSPFNYFDLDENVQHLKSLLRLNQMESLQNENLFREAS